MGCLPRLAAVLALGLAGGCADTWDRFGEGGTVGASGSGGTSGGAGASGTTLGGATDGGVVDACGALDLLFVVDNSTANEVALANIAANIGILADYLRDADEPWSEDVHVGFVRTHPTPGPCNGVGTLSADPTGSQPCATASGGAYASAADGADFGDVLTCLADIPLVDVADPPPVAMAAARGLGRPLPGDPAPDAGCNAGFLREQAIHAVVIVAAADDPGNGIASPGGPEDWAAALSVLADPAAGSELVLYGVVPDPDPPPGCAPRADNLLSWFALHERASVSDWCRLQTSPTQWVFDAATNVASLCP
ncbi:MAG: hypothetical protein D6705_10575 [Deltaproteobacteria bacterium]|nr:MAG: hypothetical protein D6705_10575 [Deltaproteobacteria bacterium]